MRGFPKPHSKRGQSPDSWASPYLSVPQYSLVPPGRSGVWEDHSWEDLQRVVAKALTHPQECNAHHSQRDLWLVASSLCVSVS